MNKYYEVLTKPTAMEVDRLLSTTKSLKEQAEADAQKLQQLRTTNKQLEQQMQLIKQQFEDKVNEQLE